MVVLNDVVFDPGLVGVGEMCKFRVSGVAIVWLNTPTGKNFPVPAAGMAVRGAC